MNGQPAFGKVTLISKNRVMRNEIVSKLKALITFIDQFYTAMTFVGLHRRRRPQGTGGRQRQRLLRGQAQHRALLHRPRAAADDLAQPSDQGGCRYPDGPAGRGVLMPGARHSSGASASIGERGPSRSAHGHDAGPEVRARL